MSRTQLLFDGASWRAAWLGLHASAGEALRAIHPTPDGPPPRDQLPPSWIEEEFLAHADAAPALAAAPWLAALVRRDPLLVAMPRAWLEGCGGPVPCEALTLRAPVLFVKEVAAGTALSYGHTWTAARASRVATIGLGYGDGYRRDFSNRGVMRLAEAFVPVVGRVCMDQTLVDVTDHPASGAIAPGAWAVALGGPRRSMEGGAATAGPASEAGDRGAARATSCDFLSAARCLDLPLAELVHGLALRVERWQAGASTLRRTGMPAASSTEKPAVGVEPGAAPPPPP